MNLSPDHSDDDYSPAYVLRFVRLHADFSHAVLSTDESEIIVSDASGMFATESFPARMSAALTWLGY
jgi:hypothetical protein